MLTDRTTIDNRINQNHVELLEEQIHRLKDMLERYENLKFPTQIRKMWSGSDVQQWLDQQHARIMEGH